MHRVVITSSTSHILFNYRKLRKLRLGKEVPDSPFFVNGAGRPLSRIQNTPGSLLNKIGVAVGIPDLNPTQLRQAAEQIIQQNDEMRKNSKNLLMHSEDVGRIIYQNKPTIRSEWIHSMDHIEGSKEKIDLDMDTEMEMKEVEEADELARLQYAEQFNLDDREQRNASRRCSKRCRVPANDRLFLQKLIYKELFGSMYQVFPGNFVIIVIFGVDNHLL